MWVKFLQWHMQYSAAHNIYHVTKLNLNNKACVISMTKIIYAASINTNKII